MERHWSMDSVIYHVYALSLAKAPFNNDYSQQEHKFSEIKTWLPHIKELGCNTVLFSPIMKAVSHGYDVTDYFTIDNRIGTNEEFIKLVKYFHENDVRVLLDCVFNHSGRDFFAFKELQNGNKDYAGWYSGVSWDHGSPLGDSFTYDTWAGHFKLPKFNLQNEQIRKYLLDAARFWITQFDIDGMRLDAADVLDIGFMRELRHMTEVIKPGFWLMGEVVHGDYSRWVNPDTLHSVTNYILYKSLYSGHNENNLYEISHNLLQSVPDNGLPLYTFLDNHDQPRIASAINNPAFLKTLYALLFTVPGVPSIYYGSEWGIQGRKENNSDQPLRPYIDIKNPPNDIPWLKEYIRRLADVRQGEEALRYGGYRQVYLEYHKPFVFERFYNNERVFSAINIGSSNEIISLNNHISGKLTDLLTGEQFDASNITIPQYSAMILKSVTDSRYSNRSKKQTLPTENKFRQSEHSKRPVSNEDKHCEQFCVKYSFKSDYCRLAHPAVIEALAAAGTAQFEGYGLDEYTMRAAGMIKEKIKSADADVHFVSGGTQANLLVISSALRPHEAVIGANSGHISVHEAGAVEATGHKICSLKAHNGKLDPDSIESVVAEHCDEHMVLPRIVYISQSTETGTVYTKNELEVISDVCRKHSLYLFIDGARLGSAMCSSVCDLTYEDLAKLADVFYIGGTKNGAMLGEAIVIINDTLKADFRFYLKQKGALIAKGAALGIQFETLFKNGLYDRLAGDANAKARRLADGIEKAGFGFKYPVQTNMIFPVFPAKLVNLLRTRFDFYEWLNEGDMTTVRLLTSWATDEKIIDEFISTIAQPL